MTSSSAWPQVDETQARRSRELIRALDNPTTLDRIGIGTTRDGFADMLFAVPPHSGCASSFSMVERTCIRDSMIGPVAVPAGPKAAMRVGRTGYGFNNQESSSARAETHELQRRNGGSAGVADTIAADRNSTEPGGDRCEFRGSAHCPACDH